MSESTTNTPRPCSDCGALPGALHDPGCDVERCAFCGYQRISCGCIYELSGIDTSELEETHPDIYSNGPTKEMEDKYDAEVEKIGGRLPWTGEWPGKAECREFDLWCYFDESKGWVICDASHPKAREDLNRLNEWAGFTWSREKRRWVRAATKHPPAQYRSTS